ncbi:hypothetical protein [Acinetobacter sp. NIPH 2699]|uniref:hypothetical protein n=1 Tax=Acinetobacter sp. NIPH 2699 TaxID=2923433 RepID=UPI001F4B891E|nr:hypothetical protein [Acinetobacter sp. NIPH 2699]MCH7335082.1 hypothetical protein [Acinetobacter sp. NIPH 2699]
MLSKDFINGIQYELQNRAFALKAITRISNRVQGRPEHALGSSEDREFLDDMIAQEQVQIELMELAIKKNTVKLNQKMISLLVTTNIKFLYRNLIIRFKKLMNHLISLKV